MPNGLDALDLLKLWGELSGVAQQAEMAVARAALDHGTGKGAPPSPEVQELASGLRVLSNKYRDLAFSAIGSPPT